MGDADRKKTVAIVGGAGNSPCFRGEYVHRYNPSVAGIFGLALAKELGTRGYDVTVFDRNRYDLTGYNPADGAMEQSASVDYNKIVSCALVRKR